MIAARISDTIGPQSSRRGGFPAFFRLTGVVACGQQVEGQEQRAEAKEGDEKTPMLERKLRRHRLACRGDLLALGDVDFAAGRNRQHRFRSRPFKNAGRVVL